MRAKSSNECTAGCMHLCGRTCLPSSVAADKRRLFFASTQAFCPALLCLTWLLSIIHVAYLDPAQFCLRDPGHYNTILNSLEISNPLLFPLLPEWFFSTARTNALLWFEWCVDSRLSLGWWLSQPRRPSQPVPIISVLSCYPLSSRSALLQLRAGFLHIHPHLNRETKSPSTANPTVHSLA